MQAIPYFFVLKFLSFKKKFVQLDQGVLGLGRGSRDYYLNASMFVKHLNAYKSYQLDVINLLLEDANVTYDLSQLIIDLNSIIDFEMKFAEVKISHVFAIIFI